MGTIFLLLAIVFEVSGTLSMKISGGFTKLWPSILMFVFYACSFTLLNLALKHIEVTVAYATWSGIGMVLIALAGYFFFQEQFNVAKICWVALIVIGTIGLNLNGKSL
ncbi:multidrug efflux SMR transporter [Paenibacillus sp. KQZ6P-2]|uniref:Multidrug efflux SMR transporter n=1 Tax=Paenibacillus mangrovi TaxID=2931978 RepID=A0A9X1WMT3_9BACL|nr:multidrug efflux SMR transporter [Paenibacillus mangrovi]MCJ8011511.1 multidrug efflux SMR transporter [Paenibacillus mangrovi]